MMWLERLVRRRDPVKLLIKQANAARDGGDWKRAAELFAGVAALRPDMPAYRVQQGHAFKESGNLDAAITAYAAAAAVAPSDIDSRIHLVALLREIGDDAGAATIYAALLQIDPGHAGARRGAVELGRRDLLDGIDDPLVASETRMAGMAAALRQTARNAESALEASGFSTGAYDRFHQTYPLRPPPSTSLGGPTYILIDAHDTSPAALRVTLDALADLVDPRWAARITSADHLRDHPIASFAGIDPRISFDGGSMGDASAVLLLEGGTRPAPLAIAWLTFALDRTGADAAYGDHDWREESWRSGVIHREPMLYDAFDPVRMGIQSPPVMALVTAAAWSKSPAGDRDDRIRRVLLSASRVVHVPRVLGSRYAMPGSARTAPADEVNSEATAASAPPKPSVSMGLELSVIIPTRDEGPALARAVATMREKAADPGRIRYVIVDNRSQLDDTRVTLAALEHDGAIVIPLDEGFNWSRANNLGATKTASPLLVFANNDVEMLTPGWDVLIEDALRARDTGACGVRLDYPDGTIQHAGILFGTDARVLSVHEGAGQPGKTGGPGGRWQQRRAVTAVTGAFLAIRRDVLDKVGGFDERLFVAYGDIDLCLKVRAQGLSVVYDPAIVLTHVESKTRGMNRTAGQIAWDESELMTLAHRWGAVLRQEPGYHPQWARGGRPFTGYREPPLSAILEHIDLARGRSAWAVAPMAEDVIGR